MSNFMTMALANETDELCRFPFWQHAYIYEAEWPILKNLIVTRR